MNEFCVRLCVLWFVVYFVFCWGDQSWDDQHIGLYKNLGDSPCKNGVEGVCVPLPACAQLVGMLGERNTTLQALGTVRRRECGFEGNNVKVCCPLNETVASKSLKSTSLPAVDNEDYVDALPEPPGCGQSRSFWLDCESKIDFVLRGKPAYKGISRWMALLGYAGDAVFWQCGGTIITTRHILTAAHCIKRNLYLVRVGQIDIASTKKYEGYPADYLIKRKIPHEEYTKFSNDIAVLVLQSEIQFNQYVAPICLPIPGVSYEKINWNMTGFISGWGITETGERSTQLLYSVVNDLGLETCRKAYQTASTSHNVTFDERVICAGAEGVDACKGDSGGPLVWYYCVKNYIHYYQSGIISYGYRCRDSKFAGVYTNVTNFMPWLMEKVLRKPRPGGVDDPPPE